MKVAFILYDGMTALDWIGVYDALVRLPDLSWDLCSPTAEVRDGKGARFLPTRVAEPLSGYEMVVVPGGFGSRALMNDAGFLAWLSTAAPCRWKISVCTGALLLGAAGFLRGRAATTHPSAFELLRPFCASVSDQRIVEEGDVITARGVTASIDLGLYLCEKLAGRDTAQGIRRQMDYPYQP